LRDFVSVYYETMRRVRAQDGYFFEEEYFLGLAEQLGETLQLFIVRAPDGEIMGGGLFTLCDGIVQYHLGGTRNAALKLSPAALMFDQVRLWGNEQGARFLHLGGGVGASEDSLFQYKAGFSHRRHTFATLRSSRKRAVVGSSRRVSSRARQIISPPIVERRVLELSLLRPSFSPACKRSRRNRSYRPNEWTSPTCRAFTFRRRT
jgi:hypothetical protein